MDKVAEHRLSPLVSPNQQLSHPLLFANFGVIHAYHRQSRTQLIFRFLVMSVLLCPSFYTGFAPWTVRQVPDRTVPLPLLRRRIGRVSRPFDWNFFAHCFSFTLATITGNFFPGVLPTLGRVFITPGGVNLFDFFTFFSGAFAIHLHVATFHREQCLFLLGRPRSPHAWMLGFRPYAGFLVGHRCPPKPASELGTIHTSNIELPSSSSKPVDLPCVLVLDI